MTTTSAASGPTTRCAPPRSRPWPTSSAAGQAAAGYDHLAGSYAALPVDPAKLRDEKFGYGLDVILHGLALRLPR